jgi:hypothetical protein
MPAGITTANFSSFEKICYAFFQIRRRRTEQKKAAYAVVVDFCED